ncbi:hypothetical protein E2553_45830 [Paraburkholderia dipogonis]|uniref:Uncharacterized protein n=1 Tax=Paraburkholderia dipogonis TaxID=1211383 RepID=A0A4Y8MHJ3_9BURK|nr:hypothetical protein [Paraburkholderia dipogonis]TFE36950.1 hypothetical protein E2553_45830 [Paraburkholderia dipogonis]
MSRQRIYLFSRYVARTYALPLENLTTIVRARDCYSPMFRAAALRHIVMQAPLHVTGGQPFAARRRAVRRFYQL